MLKNGSVAFTVFNELKKRPGTTVSAIANHAHLTERVVKSMLTRMLKEGLVRQNENDKSGFWPVISNETGFARDRVGVELVIFVNKYGEYSVKANLAGEAPTSKEGNPEPVFHATVTLSVPKETEPLSTKQAYDQAYAGKHDVAKKPRRLIIDAEFGPIARRVIR